MLKSFFQFIRLIVSQRHVIFSMAKRDIATEHAGSLLGFLWTFLHPLVLIVVFWLVFSVGFRVRPSNGVPFVAWLTAGLAVWFVFADIVNGSAGAIVSSAHLIKKTRFHSQILPVVKVVSSLMTHAVFLVILMGVIAVQGMPFSFWSFQFLYYLAAAAVFALGLGWAVSALNVFLRDIAQIVRVVLQVGFWATPVFWDIGIMPPAIQTLLKLNPMFYVVQGYRESFLYARPFWEHPLLGVYFWSVASVLFVTGALVFKRLKPHFPDVL
jgi:ABC-type polysaccharide/polyol phosphate export permease